ncbi:hypothetical protein AB838_04425 [Rhodobacteraceae bacterium (ex Bugula neritina AB1)]|nr:hypothetical protein AB838_04425 [Rhodobacteraceae bacterium (ex Bugula neritina AB1)]
MNTKLHAICDGQGRPLNLFVTAGQVSDYIGARALLGSLPDVDWLLGDRGCDADWFRPLREYRNLSIAGLEDGQRRETTERLQIDWQEVQTEWLHGDDTC